MTIQVIFPGGDNDDDDDREELPMPMVMVSLQSSSVWDGMGWDGMERRGACTYPTENCNFLHFNSFERHFASH
jgi:hypothetical protein